MRRRQRRARLPKNLQHFKVREEIRHGRIKVQAALQRSAQPTQQIDKGFLLAPDPRTAFVLHLVRCDVHMDLDGKPGERFEQAARRDPCVLGTAVAAVQPVHFFDARQQPDHGEVVRCERFEVVELVDELVERLELGNAMKETNLMCYLIQHDTSLAEANQCQLALVKIEIFTPPQRVHWLLRCGTRR